MIFIGDILDKIIKVGRGFLLTWKTVR